MFKKFLLSLISMFAASSLTAANLTQTQVAIPSTSPLYASNSLITVSTADLPGGQPATNAVPRNSTNNAIWTAPIGLIGWEKVALIISGNAVSNTISTNFITLTPTGEGVNYDSNDVITITVPNQPGSSNIYCVTNITPFLDLTYGYKAGWGVQGTNSVSNALVQVVVTRPYRVVSSPQ